MKKIQGLQIYGIFGYPLSHTLSPAMHEAAFRKCGMDAVYIVMELAPKAFQKLMKKSAQFVVSGFNVTVPYKEVVMKHLDKVSPEARAIGAVNTVFRKGKRWFGTNTDMEGFRMALTRDGKYRPTGKRAVVLGAGGAARAVVYGLSREGVKSVLLADCFPEKARKIVRDMKKIFPKVRFFAVAAGTPAVKDAIREADVIINATPLGLKPKDPCVVPGDWIPSCGQGKAPGRKFFMDLIYNPAETPFLKEARRKGHQTLNGLAMLLYQGVRAWEYWTGRPAPVTVMRQALCDALLKKPGVSK